MTADGGHAVARASPDAELVLQARTDRGLTECAALSFQV